MKRIIVYLAALAVFACTSRAQAEDLIIVLKNGTVMKGALATESANFLTINSNGSNVNVLKSIIATMNGAPYTPGDRPGAAPAAAQPAAPEAPPSAKPETPALQQPASPPPAPASQGERHIVLKNGTRFKGPIVMESANFITFNINGSKVNILKSIIASLDDAPYNPSATTDPAAQAKAAVVAQSQQQQSAVSAPSMQPAAKPAEPVVTQPARPEPLKPAAAAPAPAAVQTTPQTPQLDKTKPAQPQMQAAPAVQTPVQAAAPAAQQNQPAPAQKTQPDQTVKYGPMAPLPPPGSVKPAPSQTPATRMPPPAQSTAAAPTQPVEETVKPASPNAAAAAPSNTAPKGPEQVNTLPPASPQVQEQMKKLAVQEQEKQIQAALQLKSMGPPAASAIPLLIEMLGSDVPQLNAKGKKPAPVKSTGMTPAKAATEALVSIGTASVEPLISALAIRNRGVRANACIALGELKDTRSVDGLMTAIKDSFPEVRAGASRALGSIRDPRAIPLLVTLLGEDTSETVRNVTQTSLNNLTDIPTLIASLKDPNKVVRENVAYILFLMTAKDFRATPEQWEIWWKEQQSQENTKK